MELKELTRFPNHIIETGGHCYWDIYALYNEIIRYIYNILFRQIKQEISFLIHFFNTLYSFSATAVSRASFTPAR